MHIGRRKPCPRKNEGMMTLLRKEAALWSHWAKVCIRKLQEMERKCHERTKLSRGSFLNEKRAYSYQEEKETTLRVCAYLKRLWIPITVTKMFLCVWMWLNQRHNRATCRSFPHTCKYNVHSHLHLHIRESCSHVLMTHKCQHSPVWWGWA